MISEEELKNLENGLAGATPGPWWNDGLILMIPDEANGTICSKRMIDMDGEVADNCEFADAAEADANFVVLARNHMGSLLLEIRRLQSIVASQKIISKN